MVQHLHQAIISGFHKVKSLALLNCITIITETIAVNTKKHYPQ